MRIIVEAAPQPSPAGAREPAPWRETALFVSITLPASWALGWIWIHGGPWWTVQILMCVPGAVGLSLAWLLRRETPSAEGFAFTGAGPWVVAILYPFAMAAFCAGLAYALRAATGDPSIVYLQPDRVFFAGHHGVAALAFGFGRGALVVLPLLVIALGYRFLPLDRWPHPASLGARALLLMTAWALYPGFPAPPGSYGEELGWRGYLVRRWKHAPLVAVAITAPVWAAFHLPVLFARGQSHGALQGAGFLLSIATAAAPFAALYLWSRSVLPCMVLHFWWNVWNPLLLGDVYGGAPGLFGGKVWLFNGEAWFGAIFDASVACAVALVAQSVARARRRMPGPAIAPAGNLT